MSTSSQLSLEKLRRDKFTHEKIKGRTPRFFILGGRFIGEFYVEHFERIVRTPQGEQFLGMFIVKLIGNKDTVEYGE